MLPAPGVQRCYQRPELLNLSLQTCILGAQSIPLLAWNNDNILRSHNCNVEKNADGGGNCPHLAWIHVRPAKGSIASGGRTHRGKGQAAP